MSCGGCQTKVGSAVGAAVLLIAFASAVVAAASGGVRSSSAAEGAARAGSTASIALTFDEAHHNVHGAGNRYAALVALLETAGVLLQVNREPFSSESLQGFDVVLVPVARSAGREVPLEQRFAGAFSDGEVDAVFDWVSQGGGLWLFTDHSPSAGAVRALTDRFGVEMSNAFTADPAQAQPDDGQNWARYGFHLIFSRADGSLAAHPISIGRSAHERVERVKTFLGQSLKGPPGSVAILRLSDSALDWTLRLEDGLWQAPDPGRDVARSAAGRSQALALELGAGRVVVMGEAGLFTEIGLEGALEAEYDNGQFAINIVRWLAGDLN